MAHIFSGLDYCKTLLTGLPASTFLDRLSYEINLFYSEQNLKPLWGFTSSVSVLESYPKKFSTHLTPSYIGPCTIILGSYQVCSISGLFYRLFCWHRMLFFQILQETSFDLAGRSNIQFYLWLLDNTSSLFAFVCVLLVSNSFLPFSVCILKRLF